LGDRIKQGEGLRVLALAFGFFCAWSQLTLLRDFLDLTGGRALWIGCFLGVWLIAGGLPTLFAGRIKDEGISPWTTVLIGTAVLSFPFLSFILQWLPETLAGHAGLPVPLLASVGLGAGVSGVMSLLLGFLFLAIRSRMRIANNRSRTAQIFAAETVGFAAGALLFVVTAGWGGHILRSLLAGVVLPIAFVAEDICRGNVHRRRWEIAVVGFILVPLVILGFIIPHVEMKILKDRYAELGDAHRIESPYGRLVRIDAEWNRSFYRDGGLLFTTGDYDYAEELAHIILLQHPNPKDVLILGLGSDRLTFEVLKYPDSRVTLVEPDRALLRQWMGLHKDEIDEDRMRFINDDSREYVERRLSEFDVIILSHVDPSDLSSNRLLTIEGLRAARNALRENGVLGLGLEAEENYSDPVAVMASAAVFKSLDELFGSVLVTPLYAHIFVAGDGPNLTLDPVVLGERMGEKGIEGMFLNRYTILDRLPLGRVEGLRNALVSSRPGSNNDLNPLTFRLAFQLGMLRESPTIARIYRGLSGSDGVVQLVLLLVAAGAGFLFSIPAKNSGRIFIAVSSTFLLMGAELLLVLLWQNVGGGLITHVAVITTMAMIGAAAGAWVGNRGGMQVSVLTVSLIERVLMLELILLIVAMLLLPNAEWIALVVILIFALLIPVTVGCQFALICRIAVVEGRSDAPFYGWDLVGASVGAVAMSFLLLPLASYPVIAIILAAPKFFSAVRS
jgi:spermidine synthase